MIRRQFSRQSVIFYFSLVMLLCVVAANVSASVPGKTQTSPWNRQSAAVDPLKGNNEEKAGWGEDKGSGPMCVSPSQVLSTDAQFLSVTHEYVNNTPVAIPDNSCPAGITSTITVPDAFQIADLNVGLWISHTWRSDVNVRLMSPSGTTVQLVQDADSSADNLNVLLDDNSANAPDSTNHNVPPPYYYVTWHPTGNLADFNLEQASGTWTLTVCDDSSTDTGSLNQWTLYFTTGLVITPSQEASACEGNTIDYIFSVINTTGTAQAFSLSYSSVWPYTGPATTGTIAAGASEDITVSVTVPGSSNPMDQDVLTVTASGGGDTSQATATTTAALASGWTDVASVTAGRGVRDHSVVYYDGKLYKIGGYNGAATTFLDIYDIATDTWSSGADMPGARYWIDAVAIAGKIYVAGGYNTSGQTTLYIYDIATNVWTTGAALPAARYGYTGVAYNGIYYVIGGYTTTYTNTIIAYDTVTNTWNSGLPSMTNARRYPFSGVIGGRIYVTGGLTSASTITDTTEVFNPATSTWSTAASLPAAGWVRSADAVISDRYLIIAGGYSTDATASNYALIYDAVLDQWAYLPPMSHQIYAAEADGDGTNMWIASGRLYEGAWSYGLYTTRLEFCPSIAPENTAYYASTWGDDAVHYLDENMNDLGSFPTCTQPNGLATDDSYIYVGCFNGTQVIVYDLNGVEQISWTSPTYLNAVQGMEIVNGELAVYDDNMIHFLNPMTGAFIREISGSPSVEGLAYDGQYLWQLANTTIDATDPATGTIVRTIPNAASGCSYAGTGLTSGAAGELVIGCASGAWYRVSTADGSVLASGNNGLQIYGLGSAPGTGGCSTITITPATLPAGTVGAAYSQTVTASGGTAPYTYAVTSGVLPAGLTLNSTTGVISGTPSAGGSYTFTITATDSAACTGTITYTMDFSYGWNMSVVDDAGRSSACLNTDTGYFAWTVLTGFGTGTYVGHSNVTFAYNTYYFQSGKPSGMNMKINMNTNRASGTYMSPPLREKSICIDNDITDNPACP